MRLPYALLFALVAVFSTGTSAQTAIDFDKEFSPSVIGPGSVTTLTFTIENNTNSAATDLAFTDVLPGGMTIASPAAASTTCTSSRGGATVLDAIAGGTTLSLSGGVLAPSSTCEVTVNVTSATPGVSANTSGDLTSSLGNSGPASADLEVDTGRPGFTKDFTPSTVVRGERSTLTFTIANAANGSAASSLAFTDTLPAGMVIASPTNGSTDCPGSTVQAAAGQSSLTLSTVLGSSLPAGASCTVQVDVVAVAAGTLGNVSGELTTSVGNVVTSSGMASAVLTSLAETLQITKSFLLDPVPPGGTVPLQFTLLNIDRTSGTPATAVTFSDNLDAALAGLAASDGDFSVAACGGTISSTDGGTTLDFAGGTLGSGVPCTFAVDVTVPEGTTTGEYLNQTSLISGEVDGSPVGGLAASATLFVDTVPLLTKTFLQNPVSAGADVTLEFTVTNTSPDFAASNISFFDPLSSFLSTPLPVTLPADGFCGAGSTLTVGNSGLNEGVQLSMGSLPAGGSCTFSLEIALPIDFPGGGYTNTTSDISASINGATLVGAPATDVLTVLDGPRLVKEFTDDPVVPGGTVTLEFKLDFPSEGAASATAIGFSDDLDASLSGLVATGLPVAACGGTLSSPDFGSTLDFSGGTLAPGEACAFSVSLTVPGTASSGTYPNTTTALTSTVNGVNLVGATASDDLGVTDLAFSKAFLDDPVAPGADVTLEFTLSNGSASLPMTGVAFTDDLNSVVVGLTATTLPPSPVCGGTVSGSSLLSFSGGSLAAGETCSFSVTLGVPASAEPGLYSNVTSAISATFNGGTITAAPAADGLAVDAVVPPTLSAAFAPAFIAPGGVSQLTLTIDNSFSVESASALAVTATLAAAIEIASPTNEASTCGGTVTTAAGGSSLALTGGTVAAGSTCTVSVSVTGSTLGMYLANTTVLSSSAGPSNDASAKLTVSDAVVAVAAADRVLAECTGAAGASFALDGSGSGPDPDELIYLWEGPFGTSAEVSPTVMLPLGESTVTLTVINRVGDSSSDELVLTVEDTVGPTLTVGASSVVLWPPNHRYETITLGDLGLAVADVCDTALTAADVVVTQVSSDEPENGSGDGNTVDDIVMAPTCDAVDIRVERKGNGNGRVYAIDLGVADAAGNVATATYEAAVPKNQNREAIRDAAAYTVFGCPVGPEELVDEGATASGDEVTTAAAPPARVVPEVFALGVAYPNPMDRSARVRFDVPEASAVRLEVFDTLGRRVAVLADGPTEAGSHEAIFYAHRLPAGTYLLRFTAETGFAETRPVTVLR